MQSLAILFTMLLTMKILLFIDFETRNTVIHMLPQHQAMCIKICRIAFGEGVTVFVSSIRNGQFNRAIFTQNGCTVFAVALMMIVCNANQCGYLLS